MYAGIIKCRNPRWGSFFHPSKHFIRPNCQDRSTSCTIVVRDPFLHASFIKRKLLYSLSSRSIAFRRSDGGLHTRSNTCWTDIQFRACSSGPDGRNKSEDKHAPLKDGASSDNEKTREETASEDAKHCDAHARLGEQDQKEWLYNEKLAIEIKKKESPSLTRREKFKNEFLRRIVPWEKLHVSWDNFPYYINEHTKNTLVECVSSHLKHKKCTSSYGARLTSSSGRILLQSVPGTELYRERTVKALARDLQVPLLVLDSSVLAHYDFGDDECELDDISESVEGISESEVEDENDAVNEEEEWTSSIEDKSDFCDDDAVDVEATAEAALKKLLPFSLEEFEKRVSGESDSSAESSNNEAANSSETPKRPLNKGDRVKYMGPSIHIEADDRPLSSGQCGEVYEVNGDQVAVILDTGNDNKSNEGEKEEKLPEQLTKAPVYWIDAKDIEHDPDTETEDCYIMMEVLCEVLRSMQPIIVYFSDSSQWLSRAVPKSNHKDFVRKVQEMFGQLSGPVVLVCGQNKAETGSKEKERFTMVLPNFGHLAKLPLSLKHLTEGLKGAKRSNEKDIYKLFTNILCLSPPKEEDLLRKFNKLVEEDGKIVISRSNLNELHKVLEENEMSCMDLLHVNTDGLILTKQKAEKVIGWAKNHHLSSCLLPCIKGDRLSLPRESLEIAIVRLKEQETISEKPSQNLKNLAKDEYESNFVSAVVAPGEIGVKFNDVGALEDVKKALNELVILPMRRPELFSRGNLLRPCKGILLFGPPGTGKTLLAKALATEAEANFISITDAEKLTKALFSFASKLAPVIIFHEATRRMRNEFMAAWDGLRSEDSQRILILGATNRPFDLDDADGKNVAGAAPALRPLNLNDFIQSKAKVGPSVSFDAASMNELRKWNEQYGEGGSRKQSPFGF
uniref:AAA+ ATPase domain-containing protein n=1 Tax=Salix viminalis TaxID=40686 RepID=A0A6N2M0K6_SALVM